MAQADVDQLYEQIKATGKPGGVMTIGQIVQRTTRGTPKVIVPTVSQEELVNPPDAAESSLPITPRQLAKNRSTKDFVDAARRYADPEEVARETYQAFIRALQNNDANMVKALGPHFLGAPPRTEETSQTETQFEAFLTLVTDTAVKKQTRKRTTTVVNGELSDIQENQDAKQDQ